MTRKTINILLVTAVLVSGTWGFIRLGYWNRSVRIFSYGQTENMAGRDGREGGFRSGHIDKEAFRERESGARFRDRTLPQDSIKGQTRGNFRPGFPGGPGDSRGRGEGFRRGGHGGSSTFNLAKVSWFLAVFAAFVTITIYTDKLVKYLNVKRAARKYKSDLQI